MRIVTLVEHKADEEKKIPLMNEKEVLLVVANAVDPQAGMKVSEMGKAIQLADKIESAGQLLILEDSDWKNLCDKINTFPFGIVDKRLYALTQKVINAPFASAEDVVQRKQEVEAEPTA
jgi:hypothetical protein